MKKKLTLIFFIILMAGLCALLIYSTLGLISTAMLKHSTTEVVATVTNYSEYKENEYDGYLFDISYVYDGKEESISNLYTHIKPEIGQGMFIYVSNGFDRVTSLIKPNYNTLPYIFSTSVSVLLIGTGIVLFILKRKEKNLPNE